MTLNGKKTRILFITTGLHTGGAEIMLFKLLSSIDKDSFHVDILSLIEQGPIGERIQKLGFSVHCLGMRPGIPDPISALKLIRWVRKLNPDLIQGWMYHGNLASLFANRFLPKPKPVVWSIRHGFEGLDKEKKRTALVIKLGSRYSAKPAAIIYNSKVSAQQHEALGYSTGKTVVIPNGFDIERLSPSTESRNHVRKELGLTDSEKLVGLIARYHTHKDHGNFIQSAAYLSKIRPDVHFLLAGTNIDENNRELINSIEHVNLRPKFHLLGERNDIPRLIPGLDISCSSSFLEGFSNSLGEAMACGVPCVATDVGENSYVLGDSGITVPPKDPQAFATALNHILNLSDEERHQLGKKARDRVINQFSLPRITSQFETMYLNVLKEAGSLN